MKNSVLAALVFSLFACGDSTGPSTAAIAGTWRFSYNGMSGMQQGVAVTCNAAIFDFAITQSGAGFSGVQVGNGRLICTAGAQTLINQTLVGETIVSGQVANQTVNFRFGSVQGQQTATVAGSSMSGSGQWVFPTVTLSGQFTAARQ